MVDHASRLHMKPKPDGYLIYVEYKAQQDYK